MEIQENKRTKQILTIVICIIIAVISAIYNHVKLGEGKSIKEIFYDEGTESNYNAE